jgi:hypothetical protein
MAGDDRQSANRQVFARPRRNSLVKPRPSPLSAATAALIIAGMFTSALTDNFLVSAGWHKFCLFLTIAAAAAAGIWTWQSGVWEEISDVGATKAALILAILLAISAACFYQLAAFGVAQIITAAAGESAQIEAAVYKKAYISRGRLSCDFSPDVPLINAEKPQDKTSVQMQLLRLEFKHVPMIAEIPGNSYKKETSFCIDGLDRWRLPDKRVAVILHGKQTLFGFLVQEFEIARE